MLNKHKGKEDMYSTINNGFGTPTRYNLKSFLSDYHFMVDEKNRRLITTEIHKMDDEIQDKEKDTVCDAEVCCVIDRSEIDRTKARQMYFYNEMDNDADINKNISIQQILDSLHVFMYHTFRIHPEEYQQIEEETKDKEGDEDDEKQDDLDRLYDDKTTQKILNIIQNAKAASRRFRRTRNTAQIHNKFMTANQYENAPSNDTEPQQDTMDDVAAYQAAVYGNEQLLLQKKQHKLSDHRCATEELLDKLRKKCAVSDTDRSVLEQFQMRLNNEEYDTDSITDDLDFEQKEQSNLKQILLHRFEVAALFMQRIKFEKYTKRNVYDSGVRFFYWPYFKDNEEQRSLIYNSGTAYTYDLNTGYKLKDWYIPKKYNNLKEELTQNETKPFPMDAYDTIIEMASLKLDAYQSAKSTKRLVCTGTWWSKPYGIQKGDMIHLKHIVALLCYTNFTTYCYEFSKSFRYISPTESDESLKKRHTEFYHSARYLRECVECFGDVIGESNIPFFFHGISRSMLLDSASIKLHGPVSTTSAYQVAVSRFAQNGIVLQIQKHKGRMPYWSCSYWSAYSEEYEYLWIGGLEPFKISTIRDIPNSQRYDPLMRAMMIFHYLVDGYALDNIKVKNRDVRVVDSLIKEEQNHTLLKSSRSMVPIYFLTLFHYFLNKLDYVDIDLNLMEKEYRDQNWNGSIRYYGFKLLSPIFCLGNNPKALNYALLLLLMPNVKSVTVWRFPKGSGITKSVELNNAFVSSIIEAIMLDTRCEAFHILVPSIPDSQSLQDWINKNQKLFNNYGWTLIQDETFEHPRRSKKYSAHNTLLIKKL